MYLTDKQVIDKLYECDVEPVIINYVNFALYIAKKVSRNSWSHEAKDIRCEAILALVEGVEIMKGKVNTHPKAFLAKKIRGAVLNYVMREHTIYTPQGREVGEKDRYVEDIEQDIDEIPHQFWEHFDKEGTLIANSLCGSFLFSSVEKQILKLKIDGWTLEEIALELRMPYVQIQRILQGTRNRVEGIIDGTY